MNPEISVVLTTYKRNHFLRDAIFSIVKQSFQSWEALIVDNNAVNDAYEIVQDFKDKRLRYLSLRKNLGECGGRNFAIANSSGSYICYLDDDDILPSDSLKMRYEFMKNRPTLGMIFGEYFRFGQQTEVREESPRNEYILPVGLNKGKFDSILKRCAFNSKDAIFYLRQFNFIRAGTPLIRREVFHQVGVFDERLVLFGDYDMWLRIVSLNNIGFLNEIVYFYRAHDSSISTSSSDDVFRWNAQLLLNKHPKISNPLIKRLL